jgi:hypothetical protein
MKVFKYTLEFDQDIPVSHVQETTLEIPVGADLLTVGAGSQGVALLMLVDPDAPTEERTFITVGNGIDLPEGVSALNFRGAIKLPNISLSCFETTKVEASA